MYINIKPCPFCGGYAKLEPRSKTVIHGKPTYVTYVRCVNCDARGNRVILIDDDRHSSRELAIKYWNRRVNNV